MIIYSLSKYIEYNSKPCGSTYLAHETGDNPVEGGSLVAESLLASAQGTEVLGRLRHDVRPQLHSHSK